MHKGKISTCLRKDIPGLLDRLLGKKGDSATIKLKQSAIYASEQLVYLIEQNRTKFIMLSSNSIQKT